MERSLDPGFDARRSAIWFANRRWVFASIVLLVFAALFAGLANAPRDLIVALTLAAAVSAGITLARVVRALNTLYRCPNCATLPYQTLIDYKCGGLGPSRSDFMSPTHCPNCGTRIR